MGNKKQLTERLRSSLFKLSYNSTIYTYKEMMSRLAQKLNKVIPSAHIDVYVYNDWTSTYNVATTYQDSSSSSKAPSFIKDINIYADVISQATKSESIIKGESIFKDHPIDIQTFILSLNPMNKPKSFLLLTFEVKSSIMLLLEVIRAETEQFLNIANLYYFNMDSNRRNKLLFDLSAEFHSTNNKMDILKQVVEGLKKVYSRFNFQLFLSQDYEKDESFPIEMISYGDEGSNSISTKAFVTGKPQIQRNSENTSISLYTPLKGNQAVYGVIGTFTTKVSEFPKEDISFITKLANMAGKAIEGAILYRNSNHLVSELQLINAASHELNSSLDLSEISSIVKRKVLDTCGATEIGFVYFNEVSNEPFEILAESTSYFTTEEGHLFTDYLIEKMEKKDESIFSGDYQKTYKGLPYRSLMSIPMMHAGTNHGFIVIMHEEDSFFTFESYKLIQSLIRHSALALTNTILKDKLTNTVITDYLTKLYSRNHLDNMLKLHMKEDNEGTFLLFDIDDFKKVNDIYGHHIGDEVIIQIANIIKSNIRQYDVAARWGGEELAIYLPNSNLKDGVKLAERIRKKIEENTDPKVTMSCGVSTWMQERADTVSDVFIRADTALYKAKELGKNRIEEEDNVTV